MRRQKLLKVLRTRRLNKIKHLPSRPQIIRPLKPINESHKQTKKPIKQIRRPVRRQIRKPHKPGKPRKIIKKSIHKPHQVNQINKVHQAQRKIIKKAIHKPRQVNQINKVHQVQRKIIKKAIHKPRQVNQINKARRKPVRKNRQMPLKKIRHQPQTHKQRQQHQLKRGNKRKERQNKYKGEHYNIAQGQLNKAAKRWKRKGMNIPPKPSLVSAGGQKVEWPCELPVYVITINENRWNAFSHRSKVIGKYVTKWNGTNGHLINRKEWNNKVAKRLKRGEIGCYDSHVRLWKEMVAKNQNYMLICEDDGLITGSPDECKTMVDSLTKIKESNWDIAFMSWFRPFNQRPISVANGFVRQWTFCQLFAYIITLKAAKKLLSRKEASYYGEPVDTMLFTLHSKGVLNNVVRFPPISLPVAAGSDTRNIR